MTVSKMSWMDRLQQNSATVEMETKSKMKKLIPKVRTGCCGCSTYNSSVAIAIILISFFTAGGIYLAYYTPIWIDSSIAISAGRNETNDYVGSMKGSLYGMMAFLFVNDIPNMLLLFGIFKNRHLWMLPWIIFYGAILTMYSVLILLLLIGVFMSSGMIAAFLFHFIIFAFIIYFWLIIVTLYREFRKEVHGKSVSA